MHLIADADDYYIFERNDIFKSSIESSDNTTGNYDYVYWFYNTLNKTIDYDYV